MGWIGVLNYDLRSLAKRVMRASLPEPERYPNFDLIRLFAALSVVAMHCNNYVALGQGGAGLWGGCFFPVPVFLGLSGFLVLGSFAKTGNWARFAWKRACRIIPAWLASLVLVAASFGLAATWECMRVWATLGLTLGFGGASRNGPLWSLGWEELFYAGLAVLYLLGAYRRPVIIWGLGVSSTLIAWLVISSGAVTEGHRLAMWALPSSFFIGNLAYLYRTQLRRVQPAVCLALLVAAATANLLRSDDLGVQFLLQQFLVISALLVGVAGPTLVGRRFADISYGIYVYHAPLVPLVFKVVGLDRWALLFSVLALVVPLAALSWVFVERPALSAKGIRFRWPRRAPETGPKAAADAA